MLLPSLLPCDSASRALFPSHTPLFLSQVSPMRQNMDETSTSCRALQEMMGASSPNTFCLSLRPQRPKLMRSPANTTLNHDATADPPRPHVKDRTLPFQSGRKHKRDDSAPIEDTLTQHGRTFSSASTLASVSPVLKEAALQSTIPSPMFDQENNLEMDSQPFAANAEETERPYSTPKRRRLAPLSMPLGLSASDFESLNMPPGYGPPPSDTTDSYFPLQHHAPSEPQADTIMQDVDGEPEPFWNPSDDLALVSMLLEKFRLSKRDWNECARILGRDKDSLSRRWRYLIGNGNVGLRRSSERGGRGRLDGLHGDFGG